MINPIELLTCAIEQEFYLRISAKDDGIFTLPIKINHNNLILLHLIDILTEDYLKSKEVKE